MASGGDEVVTLRLLLRAGERVGGARATLLAEDELELARRPQPLRGVRPEGRARLVQAQRAQEVAPEEACFARHLARLRHRPPHPVASVYCAASKHPRGRSSPDDPANGGDFVTIR